MTNQSERLFSAAWFGLLGFIAGVSIQISIALVGESKNRYIDSLILCLLPFFLVNVFAIAYSILFKRNICKMSGVPFLIVVVFLGLLCSVIQLYYELSFQTYPFFMAPGIPRVNETGLAIFLVKQGLLTLSIAAILGYFYGYRILLPYTTFIEALHLGFLGGTLGYILYMSVYFQLWTSPLIAVELIILGYILIGWAVSFIGVISAWVLWQIKKIFINQNSLTR